MCKIGKFRNFTHGTSSPVTDAYHCNRRLLQSADFDQDIGAAGGLGQGRIRQQNMRDDELGGHDVDFQA